VGEVNLPADLHTQLAQAARELHAEPDIQRTMERSVLLATELIPNCDHAWYLDSSSEPHYRYTGSDR
jgi:hypothetical protein